MLSGKFIGDRFSIDISFDRFCILWDDSYEGFGDYRVPNCMKESCISVNMIDLDSFVADQVLTVLNEEGREDCDINNEVFENYAAVNCVMRKINDSTIHIEGSLVEL